MRIFNFKNLIKNNYILLRSYATTSRLPRPSKGTDAAKYFLFTVPITTFGLGVWQVNRRTWKLNLINELQEKTSAEPIDLPIQLEDVYDLEYRKVKVRGKFDYYQELYLSPRSLVDPARENAGGGLITAGNRSSVGLWVVTPFQLSDRKERILVNRGWITRSQLQAYKQGQGRINDEIDLVGVVRRTEKRPPFGTKNDIHSQEWKNRDLMAMAQVLNTAPVFIDADANSTVPGGPIGGQTRVSLRNEHMSYIVTWFSLSILTSYVWYMKFVKKIRV